ncbi:hypothetical protein FAP39_17050 [Shimia litoralis]|uniref:Uncharacterized protein n=1 Tax=Shimia litoralis TaxID=420403 RepID=A0A4U7MR85_9RHOB|nr:hypothetical protein [Shimia litoralis]TKZ15470.1 hypothetical protein FAP39_17050 [Shimia litoralis]
MFPTSFPAQNTHRLVVFHPDSQPVDIERLEDLAADGVKALREGFEELNDLRGDLVSRTHKATRHLREHLANRDILSDQFKVDMEQCLERLERQLREDANTEGLSPIRSKFLESLAASNRVADLVAAERIIGRLREQHSGTR